MEMTLEREFMWEVLRKKMIKYYEVVLAGTIQLPAWFGGDTPEKCAARDVKNLYNRDFNKFINMYEKVKGELLC